jgi:hypothetical protein
VLVGATQSGNGPDAPHRVATIWAEAGVARLAKRVCGCSLRHTSFTVGFGLCAKKTATVTNRQAQHATRTS